MECSGFCPRHARKRPIPTTVKTLRSLILFFLLLSTSFSLLAGGKHWDYIDPTFKKFRKAYESHKWQQAAKLAQEFDLSTTSLFACEQFAEVYCQLQEWNLALECKDRCLLLEYTIHKQSDPSNAMKRIVGLANYLEEHALQSSIPSVNAYALHRKGRSVEAFQQVLALLQATPAPSTELLFAAEVPGLQNALLLEIGSAALAQTSQKADWPAAAAIVDYLIDRNIPLEGNFLDYAELCLRGDSLDTARSLCERYLTRSTAETLRAWAERWISEGFKVFGIEQCMRAYEFEILHSDFSKEQRLVRCKEAADFAAASDLQSNYWLINIMVSNKSHTALDTMNSLVAKLKELKEDSDAQEREMAKLYLSELFIPALSKAFADENWLEAAKIVDKRAYLTGVPLDAWLRDRVIKAYEKAGYEELALRVSIDYLWYSDTRTPRVCDVQGDPLMVQKAASLAHRNELILSNPIVEAYLQASLLNPASAIAILEAMVRPKASDPDPCRTALALFILGDIHNALHHRVEALSYYHKATYYVSSYCSLHVEDEAINTHFHEVLGVTRQVAVLLTMKRPDLALREMDALLAADPSLMEAVIKPNESLQQAWASAKRKVQDAFDDQGKPAAYSVALSSLVDGDEIFVGSQLSPRIPASVRIPEIREKLQQSKVKYAKAQEEERYAAMRRANAGESRFMQSYREANKKPTIIVSSEDPAPSSNRSFDVQGRLNASKKAQPSRRRCSFCLGSGKANYVSGNKYVELDHNNSPTGRAVDPACTHCNGTGYR